MKHGRPTKNDQNEIKIKLQSYYNKGISANATSKETKINIKTVLKYFNKWNIELVKTDGDFLSRVKIEKERNIQFLDREIISLETQENEIDAARNNAKITGNIFNFERLSLLQLKIKDQKLKVLSAKTNLIMTPIASDIAALEKNGL